MDAQSASAATFEIRLPNGRAGPLVFASPHSGQRLPVDMRPAPGLDQRDVRSAEDTAVDLLLDTAPDHGVPLICALVSRAYVDLNRSATELDPVLTPDIPAHLLPTGAAGARVASGYGVVARRSGDGRDLYDRTVPLAEVRARLTAVHAPYHNALSDLMRQARDSHGRALLVDWHSMPSDAAGSRGGPDVVLGNRHGAACEARVTRKLKSVFEQAGWTVAMNRPYAGGYTTQVWGRPSEGFQAVQIELNRALYLDEASRTLSPGFVRCRSVVARAMALMVAEFG
ncbi:N-formylglutamate amidohydrolase [Brevundimonas sp. VNH65]|uniref:N-formylglutamate amidohydrolase n=1 Tax=Brevundimonas sp. VNH65 TaxID=3400917 RepID=UPI003C05E0ED